MKRTLERSEWSIGSDVISWNFCERWSSTGNQAPGSLGDEISRTVLPEARECWRGCWRKRRWPPRQLAGWSRKRPWPSCNSGSILDGPLQRGQPSHCCGAANVPESATAAVALWWQPCACVGSLQCLYARFRVCAFQNVSRWTRRNVRSSKLQKSASRLQQ